MSPLGHLSSSIRITVRFVVRSLVNEAIIDVGIGMAQFQNAYYRGFMPKVGCPGCNGDTMEYVEQDK